MVSISEFQYLDAGNSEVQDKQADAFRWKGVAGVAATGVIEGLAVTQTGTASGSVLISIGSAVDQGSLGQGVDQLVNSSQKTLDVFTANPVGGLARNDIVAFDSVTSVILTLIGTPNASPSDPTVLATAVALARLRHAASATTIPTSKIDDLRVYTSPRGVMLPAVSAKVTTSSSTISTVDVTLVNAPAVLGDGIRKFKITASFHTIAGGNADSTFDCHLVDSTTMVTLSTHRLALRTLTDLGVRSEGLSMVTTDVPSAGSHVYRLAVMRTGGLGNPLVSASSTAPIEIIVEQVA